MYEAKRILHVLNYGWPFVDGYTIRSLGLVTAQERHLGLEAVVAVTPFRPLTRSRDPSLRSPHWTPERQCQLGGSISRVGGIVARLEHPGRGLAPLTSRRYQRDLANLIDRVRPDLVHVHHPHYVAAPAQAVAAAADLPCVYEIRCFNGDYDCVGIQPWRRLRGLHFNRLERRACLRSDAVVTISRQTAERVAALGVPADRVFVVRNSVDTERFRGCAAPRASAGLLRIGYATTFNVNEGLENLVEAAAILRARGCPTRFVVVGDGPVRERVRRRVRRRGLEGLVSLPGFLPYSRIPEFYGSLDAFIIPRADVTASSLTTPLKPLEALAAGLPILASDLPALRELLGDREDVAYFRPDPAAIASGVEAFIERPRPPRPGGIENRRWEDEVGVYRDVYRSAMKRRKP